MPQALDALADELHGPNRLRAAALVLERAGFHADKRTSIEVVPRGPATPEGVAAARADAAAFQELFSLTW